MADINFLDILYTHRAEMSKDGLHDLLMQDEMYLKAKEAERLAEKECCSLNLTAEERQLINDWSDQTFNESGAYARCSYRMGMIDCFSLMKQLGGF